mmetsp:Transcript_22158/g.30905  ORF Transcript_22158/g.30905 Transcript_22158/m.30905 type:complete len:203 (-) Transcript_22158:21-629(-)
MPLLPSKSSHVDRKSQLSIHLADLLQVNQALQCLFNPTTSLTPLLLSIPWMAQIQTLPVSPIPLQSKSPKRQPSKPGHSQVAFSQVQLPQHSINSVISPHHCWCSTTLISLHSATTNSMMLLVTTIILPWLNHLHLCPVYLETALLEISRSQTCSMHRALHPFQLPCGFDTIPQLLATLSLFSPQRHLSPKPLDGLSNTDLA